MQASKWRRPGQPTGPRDDHRQVARANHTRVRHRKKRKRFVEALRVRASRCRGSHHRTPPPGEHLQRWPSPVLSRLGGGPYVRLERHDDQFFLAIRLYSEGHCETKESPMRSVWVDLITEDPRPLWPDGLKPC